jgi:alkylation response protein AidB-like acyl-CoA dehydrogenase
MRRDHDARRESGAHFVLNGVKQFITSGKNAALAIVFAVTDKGGRQERHQRIRRPDFDARLPVARIEDKTGSARPTPRRSCSRTAKVPVANLLAQEGMGYRIALANLEIRAHHVAAQATGMASTALEAALILRARAKEHGQDAARAPGGELPPRRHGDGVEAARQLLICMPRIARRRAAVPQGSVDGEAVCVRTGREGLLGCDP